jgi:clan AA aspartic protease
MITGSVVGRQPRVGVVLRIPGRQDIEIEFVVDTGFDGFLTLPSSAVEALGLPFVYRLNANFANDTDMETAVHQATILWNGEQCEVEVLATGRRPLLGTLLMDGFDLNIRFADKGHVTFNRFG